MKDQINRYARGALAYKPLKLHTKNNSITSVVDKNQYFTGSLELFSEDERAIRGLVRTDNDKILIENAGFDGAQIRIDYAVMTNDCVSGDCIEGEFHIISNGGEFTIPYSFRVESGSFDSSMGMIRNLSQFTELAKNNPDEAVAIFMNVDFGKVYFAKDAALTNLYEGVIKGVDLRNNLEEFLVATGRKNPIHLTLSDNNRKYENVEENFKDTIVLERDSWGYLNVKVSTQAPFIRLERRTIDSDSFSGNRYEFSYVIDANKLHAGRNHASIVFEANHMKLVFSMVILKGNESSEEDIRQHIVMKKLTMDMMTLYIRFRTHAIPVEEWIRETRIVLEALSTLDETHPFYKLALAQLFITEKRDEEAKALMEEVKDEVHAQSPKGYPIYCYFIYVNTLYNKEYAYSKRASAIIKDCYERYDDWRILWTLLFIDEELENNASLKLLRIKEQYNRGCHSPVMYLEACRILNEEPHLLRVINGFEAATLYFGAKNHIIEEKLCSQAASLIISQRYGTQKFIRLMWSLYQNHPTKELLEVLCKILVRNSCTGTAYLAVYEEAIRAQLKVTQLFEYYIMSRKMDDMSPLPKMVLMYFGYNNNLDYQTKAYLYANIIYNKRDNPQAYRSYQPQMQSFITDQLLLGHVNGHLCTIYEDILTPEMVNEENAAAIAEIFATYLIQVAQDNITAVVVRHKELDVEKEYPVYNQEVLVRMYTEDACVFLKDDMGNRYILGPSVIPRRLIENDEILKRCLEIRPDLLTLALHYSEKNSQMHKNSLEAASFDKKLLENTELNETYRSELISGIINYYFESYDAEAFTSFMEQIEEEDLSIKDYEHAVEIYIVQGAYEHAFKMLANHSALHINPKRLLKLCSRMIINHNGADARLVYLSHLAFVADRYDDVTLQYLSDYYVGSTQDLLAIWRQAIRTDVDTYELEERMITQILFAGVKTEAIEEVFERYYARSPKERTVEAYLAYYSYEYFVRKESVSESIFELIEVCIENDRTLANICGMALTLYYTTLPELSAFRKEIATKLVYELTRKDYIFPHFLRLADAINLPFEVSDLTMVEFDAAPNARVVIHYMVEHKDNHKDYVACDMKQVYDGMFVQSFILFYGEQLTYYITCELDGVVTTTPKKMLSNDYIRPDRSDGRYDAMNDLIASAKEHDGDTVEMLVRKYASEEYITEQLFKPI